MLPFRYALTCAVAAVSVTTAAAAQDWAGAYMGASVGGTFATLDYDGSLSTTTTRTLSSRLHRAPVSPAPAPSPTPSPSPSPSPAPVPVVITTVSPLSGMEDLDSASFGASAGYRWQSGAFVFGIEAGARWADLGYSSPGTDFDVGYALSLDRMIEARAMAGYALSEDWLAFGSIGVVQAQTRTTIGGGGGPIIFDVDQTRMGHSFGFGASRRLNDQISLTAELLYYDLGSETISGIDGPSNSTFTLDQEITFTELRLGLNFQF